MSDLRAIAEAATPETAGRWRYRRCDFGHGPDPDYSYVEWGAKDGGLGTAALSVPMARYIAAWSPDRTLAALDVIEAARELWHIPDSGNGDSAPRLNEAYAGLRAALTRWEALA